MRYTKQHSKVDCVPTAITNASKFFGKKISYRDHKHDLIDLLDVCELGTYYPTFLKFMKKIHKVPYFGFKLKKIHKKVKFKNLVINDNQIAMFLFASHISLVIKKTDKRALCLNFYSNKTKSWISKKMFDKMSKENSEIMYLEKL